MNVSIHISEIKELPRNDLIELVAGLWEARPGWKTVIVEPGEDVELNVKSDTLDITVPELEDQRHDDVEVSADIVAIQETPYVELEYIHVRSEYDVIEDTHFNVLEGATTGYKIRKAVIVTTGAGPENSVDRRLYSGNKMVDGEELCELIDQYKEYGFNYEEHL